MKTRAVYDRRGLPLAMDMADIARVMTARGFPMGRSSVRDTIKRALRKLREHPEIRELAVEANLFVDD